MKKLFKRLSVLFTVLLTLSLGVTHDVKEVKAANTYSYTFSSKVFSANGTQKLGDKEWTLSGDGSYYGYDGTKGHQFGSGGNPNKSMSLESESFSNVTSITINTSGASSINASFVVSVGGESVGSSTKLTTSATDYTFTPSTALSGNVKFSYTQSSSKAIYIKSIVIDYAEAGGKEITFEDTDLSNQETKASLSFDYSLTYGSIAYQLVTDASSLIVGDKLIIASNQKNVVAGDINSQYLTKKDATFSEDLSTIESAADAVLFTLGGSENAWTLANENGQLLGATEVKKLAWDASASTWSISIDEDSNATIQNNNSSYGRFLYNVTSPRFTTYTSASSATMVLPQLYKVVTIDSNEEKLVSQFYDDVKIKFGVEVSKDLFDSTPSGAGLIVSQREIQTGAADATLDEYMASNSNYKALSLGSAPTLTNNKYSVAGAIQVYEDDEFASATDTKLTTVLYASVYFVVNDKVVILKSSQYSVKTMLEYYSNNAESLGITGDTLTAVNAFNDFIA